MFYTFLILFFPALSAGLLVKIFMTKHVVLCLTLILSLGAVNACSQQTIPNSSAQNTSNNTQKTPDSAGNTSSEGFLSAPVVAPPSYDQRPLKPGESPPAQTMPNGLPALKPLKGVNVDTLFAENLSNSDRRFERLENVVKDMRREFEAVKPAIVRLVAVESDIQQMVEQLETLAAQERNTPAMPAPVLAEEMPTQNAQPQSLVPQDLQTPKTADTAKPMTPKTQAMNSTTTSNAANTSSGPIVKNLRTGQHKDKMRLVLDLSKKTPYSVDLDSGENILIIELPQAKWSGVNSKNFSSKKPLLASYSVDSINNGQGSRIIIPLKKSSTVLKHALLPPNTTSYHRVYVDLKL